MNFDLIDDDTLDALPDDSGLAFVMFERACRASLMQAVEREGENDPTRTVIDPDDEHGPLGTML